MARFKHWIRNYFGFSKAETNGSVVLIILMVLILSVPFLFDRYYNPDIHDLSQDHIMLDSLVAEMERNKISAPPDSPFEDFTPKRVELFLFNPNHAELTHLEALGLQPWIAARIIKYRESGGSFKIKSDLQKIYSLPEETYQRLYPFIDLPEELIAIPKRAVVEKAVAAKEYAFPEPAIFDINEADTAQLKKIYGIGEVLSARIIKYRDLLGGFISKNQYKEVYGLEEVVIEKLIKSTRISESFASKKININTATAADLSEHPYISYKLADVIVAFRSQHGLFSTMEDLKKIKILEGEDFDKISPYLTL